MSEELKKAYKVIQPVVHGVRREIGEVLELTAEEAEQLASFVAPVDEQSETKSNEANDSGNESQQNDQGNQSESNV